MSEVDPLDLLRRFTSARIGLGRAGNSTPTRALLEFELAHARARDAVDAEMDADGLARSLRDAGWSEAMIVRSEARDRMQYLLRPDLGRALAEESRQRLGAMAHCTKDPSVAVVVADGLSSIAPERHALPLLEEVRRLHGSLFANVTMTVAMNARVALGDEIGAILQSDAVVVLIGERPGLSSPDSLGIYLTWAPRVGRSDAERNCISNVRPEGLSYAEAAQRLAWLLQQAQRLRLSGVGLKDDSGDDAAGLPELS